MTFFTDTPRALAVSPDKSTVFVAGFKTGNQTTSLIEEVICSGFGTAALHRPRRLYQPWRTSGAGH